MIARGKVVSIHYEIAGSEGEAVDRTMEGFPFRYIHGASEIAPGLEQALEGLRPGDRLRTTLPPDLAYGEGDESLRIAMEPSQCPQGVRLVAGESFRGEANDGASFVFEILRVEDGTIHVDGNHPFSGKTLQFDVSILAVRDATNEETETGRVAANG